MAYNLPMQINLQAPPASNISAIKKSIEAGIGNIKVADIGTASFAKANAQVKNLTKTFDKGEASAKSFFDTVEGKARSYAAYAVASTAILKLSGTISQATREAIKYEKELINIAQTTDKTIGYIKGYSDSLIEVSKKYNVNITQVAKLTRILAQTGLSFKESAKAAELLARTSLLAGFDNLQDTTEGLIATLQTFEVSVTRAAKVLEAINAVSKAYAVESGDLVEAIRRSGAAFKSAGGQIEELLALFTSVRSTTRESAETIATGFRTIFARLQRPKTIEFFEKLGIQLQTAEGQFIGPYQAILKISEGLEKLGYTAGTVGFAKVVEEIGGIRQISRVIPLLEQVKKTQEALAVANNAGATSIQDLEKAQQGLGFRLGALQKEFTALVASVVDSSSFKFLADVFIGLSKSVLGFVSALKPLFPLLTFLATWTASKALGKLFSGKMSFKGMTGLGMASGGLVPGSGNRDTVPAMLTPGEFVIRKSAVNAIGANRLASINKYAYGGTVKDAKQFENYNITTVDLKDKRKGLSRALGASARGSLLGNMFEGWLYQKFGVISQDQEFPDIPNVRTNTKAMKAIGNNLQPNIKHVEFKYKKELADKAKYTKEFNQNNTAVFSAFNKGGSVGTDTVPAMLTPGEFVVNKKSAQAYGYANLKKINKYKNGGMVGSAKGNINTDLERGTGNLIYTIDELEKEINNIVNGLGTAGDKIKQMNLQIAVAAPKQMEREGGRIARGSFDPRGKAPVITTTAGVGTQSTVAHEVGHAVDYSMGGGKGYASKQEGTLQNTLAKLAKDQIAVALRAKGVSEEDIKYRTDLKELFADLFEKSEPDVRAILASTSDFSKGMHLLAKSSAVTSRLYGDIQKNLKIEKETKKEPEREPLTKKKLDEELKTGGRGAIQEEIKGKAQELKALQEAQKKAEEAYLQNASNLEKLDNELVKGIAGNRAYNRAVEAKIKLEQQVAASEAEYKAITEQVTNTRKEKEALQAKSKGMKQAALATLTTPATAQATTPVTKATNNLATTLQNGATKIYKALSNMEMGFVEFAGKIQIAASALQNFAGINVNQEVLTQATVKGGMYAGAGETVEAVATRKNVFMAGKALQQFGSKIPGVGGKIATFGATLAKNAGSISKSFASVGRGLALTGKIELLGGFVDAIFSVDYGAQKDKLIELGDATGAAAAAAKEFAQEGYRGIPLIGGFLSAMGAGSGTSEKSLDATGRLAVANARLAAETVNAGNEVQKAKQAFSEAAAQNDLTKQQDAFGRQLDAVDYLNTEIANVGKKMADVGDSGFNFGRIVAAGGAGLAAGAGIGSAAGAVVGGVAGGVAGAAAGGVGAVPGAVGGAAAGSALGTKIGAVVGAVGYAGYELYRQMATSKEQIVKGYQLQQEAIKQGSEIMVEGINQFGGALQAEVSRVVKAGGSYGDALKNVTERFGQQNVDRLLKGRKLGTNAEEDAQTLTEESNALDEQIKKRKLELTTIKDSDKKTQEKIETEIAKIEADKAQIDALKTNIITAGVLEKREKQLAAERKVAAAAIEKEIKLRKSFQKAIDKVSQVERDAANVQEEAANIGTGKLTFREAAASTGVNPRVLEMSTDEIMRNKDALAQMTASLDRFGGAQGVGAEFGNVLRDAQKNMDAIEKISDPAVIERAMQAVPRGEGTDANELKKKLLEEIGIGEGTNEALDAAVLEYAKAIAEGGPEAAAQAEEAARETVTKLAQEFIEQNKEKLKKLAEMEQQYREMEIELVNKRSELAQKAYDNERDYFEKRLALSNKVSDALEIEPTGPGKAARIAAKGKSIRDARMGNIAMAAPSVPSVEGFKQSVDAVNKMTMAGQNAGTKFAELAGQGQLLLNVIGDQINAEQEYLDALIDSAKAQQAYTQELFNAQGQLVEDLVFGTDEQRAETLNTMNATVMAAQQGSLEGIPESQRGAINNLLTQFENVEIPGLGKTGKDVKRDIATNELMKNFGMSRAEAEAAASKMVEDQVPIDQKMAVQIENQQKILEELYAKEKAAKDAQLALEKTNTELFARKVEEFGQHIDKMKAELGLGGAGAGGAMAGGATGQVAAAGMSSAMQTAANFGQNVISGKVGMNDVVSGTSGAINTIGSAFGAMFGAQQKKTEEEDQGMAMAMAQATEEVPTYGLTRSQRDYAQGAYNTQQEIDRLEAGNYNEEESQAGFNVEQRIKELKDRKARFEGQLSQSGAGGIDVGSYQAAYARNQTAVNTLMNEYGLSRTDAEAAANKMSAPSQTNGAVAPATNNGSPVATTAPTAPVTPATTGQQAANGGTPIQVQTQGQQEITIRLPDIQALVNQAITATVFETVAETFTNIANDVRSASNFDDVANALVNGMERTTNKETGGQA